MTGSLQVRLSLKARKIAPIMRQIAPIIFIAIICISISPAFAAATATDYPQTGGQSLQIIDHAMAGSVEELSMEAIDRREAFLTSDIKACSWVSFGDILSEHLAEWKWYSPDGGLYQTCSQEIPLPSSDLWNWYNVYSCIDIVRSDASRMPGSWHVDIYLDDQKVLTEQFTITPSEDLSYSSTTQGGCYTDTKTGQVICIDKTGDSSSSGEGDQAEEQGGCYADPMTGAVVCVDVFGNPYGQDGSFGPEETEGYSQPPPDAGPTGETEMMEQGESSQGASTESAGKMAAGLREAKPKEIMADLVVYEMTIDGTTYSFNAVKEEGAWKISGL